MAINHLISSKIINDKEYKKRLVEFIKVFDLGIDDIEVKTRDIKDINFTNSSISSKPLFSILNLSFYNYLKLVPFSLLFVFDIALFHESHYLFLVILFLVCHVRL